MQKIRIVNCHICSSKIIAMFKCVYCGEHVCKHCYIRERNRIHSDQGACISCYLKFGTIDSPTYVGGPSIKSKLICG